MPVPDDSPSGEDVYDAVQKAQFSPYEPEPVHPTLSPASSSLSPGSVGGTSEEDGEAAGSPDAAQAEEQDEAPTAFDPRYIEPFTGLLFLGRLEKTFTKWGHTFVVKTLTTEELAEISLFMQRYEGTRAQNAIYQSAQVAASVVTVDGHPLPLPLGAESGLTHRIEWVMRNWMPAVREVLWEEVFDLETRTRDVLAAMGKASG